MQNVHKKRRACLIGIPQYRSTAIGNLDVVRTDITQLQMVLESSGYQVETHCPNPGEPDMTLGNLRKTIKAACRTATSGETLLIYFSGHGGHFSGKDYLIPSDADLMDPEDFDDYLLPVDFIANAVQNCKAELILFLVDACREGLKLDAKAIALHPWNAQERRLADGQSLVTVFACSKGQYAQFYQANQPDDSYSLFTKALCHALGTSNAATMLGDVLEESDKMLDALVRQHNKMEQNIWVLGETSATRRTFPQVICDATVDPTLDGPNPWVNAISASRLWSDDPLTDEFKAIALEFATTCWRQYQAMRRVLPNDPWVNEQLPIRVLGVLHRLTSQMDKLTLSPAESTLLHLAPILREAVLARAVEQMAEYDPLSTKDTGSSDGFRAVLEKVHRAYPRLLRKMERLHDNKYPEEANQVAFWLMHCSLLREPRIWVSTDTMAGLFDGMVADALADFAQTDMPMCDVLNQTRLLELAQCCYATPERIERTDRPNALQNRVHAIGKDFDEDMIIRERLLGYLLLVAGAMAIDPRYLSEVLVEHIGISHAPSLDTLLAEIAQSRWEPESTGRRLRATCTHSASDYVLTEHVEYANTLLVAAHRASEQRDSAPLAFLPVRFSADGVQPKSVMNVPAYRTPHLRFRLAQDQVLELLMGEQLYGDPSLAIRELYQNALDACRYAEARLTYLKKAGISNELDNWTGAIRFYQGTDESGRPYIECEDNGIGMGVRELTDIFTQAGRRFADTPEFR
ncbi:MAG: caspase family protein [Chloroflexota bacterium]